MHPIDSIDGIDFHWIRPRRILCGRALASIPIHEQKPIDDPDKHIADLAVNQQPYANVQERAICDRE
jgi:hypothetical protein